jgi:hypothetical protein
MKTIALAATALAATAMDRRLRACLSAPHTALHTVRVPELHAEFLIDRSGYIRARWLPVEDDSWSDPGFIETQLEMGREPPEPPPPGPHEH